MNKLDDDKEECIYKNGLKFGKREFGYLISDFTATSYLKNVGFTLREAKGKSSGLKFDMKQLAQSMLEFMKLLTFGINKFQFFFSSK